MSRALRLPKSTELWKRALDRAGNRRAASTPGIRSVPQGLRSMNFAAPSAPPRPNPGPGVAVGRRCCASRPAATFGGSPAKARAAGAPAEASRSPAQGRPRCMGETERLGRGSTRNTHGRSGAHRSRIPPVARLDHRDILAIPARRRPPRRSAPVPSAIPRKFRPSGGWPSAATSARRCFFGWFFGQSSGRLSRQPGSVRRAARDSPPARRSIAFRPRSIHTLRKGVNGLRNPGILARLTAIVFNQVIRSRVFLADNEAAALVSPPAGSVGPGPSDQRTYTIYPVGKPAPYGIADPPGVNRACPAALARGIRPPAEPDAEGRSTTPPGTPQFEMAHLYGTVRFVLDCGRATSAARSWHFRRHQPPSPFCRLRQRLFRLRFHRGRPDRITELFVPYSLNFDVIAHEVGTPSSTVKSVFLDPGRATAEHLGSHESAADLVALVASLHFDSLVDDLRLHTRGNLYTLNALSRMAELSATTRDPDRRERSTAFGIRRRLEEGARTFRAADRRVLRYPCRCLSREPARRRADHAGSGRAFRQASGDTAVPRR